MGSPRTCAEKRFGTPTYTAWLLLTVDPNKSKFSLNPRPQVLLLKLPISSRPVPSGRMRQIPWRKFKVASPDLPWNPLYPTDPHTRLSNPQRKLLGPEWVSRIPHPV